jgi:hypothetical protein
MNQRNTFLRGFGVVMLFHLLQFPVFILCALFGLIQLAYVIPLALKAQKLGETARLQGILAAAGLTVLLNGTCDFIMFRGITGH